MSAVTLQSPQSNPHPPPQSRTLGWDLQRKNFHFFHSENKLIQKFRYILLTTVTHLYHELMKIMKFCVEVAVTAFGPQYEVEQKKN